MLQSGFKALNSVINVGDVLLSRLLPPFFSQNVIKYIEDPNYRKYTILLLILTTFVICIFLYQTGYEDSQLRAKANTPELLAFAPYLYNPWFVYIALITCLGGFALAVFFLDFVPIAFMITTGVYLVSFILLFSKLYFSYVAGSSAVNVYTFNILINTLFATFTVLGNATSIVGKRTFFALLGLVPSFGFGGFWMYCGKYTS
jgi:hypothetical protein